MATFFVARMVFGLFTPGTERGLGRMGGMVLYRPNAEEPQAIRQPVAIPHESGNPTRWPAFRRVLSIRAARRPQGTHHMTGRHS